MNNEPHDESPEIGESAGDRHQRYVHSSLSEVSSLGSWMCIHHFEGDSSDASGSEALVAAEPNPVRDRLLEVLEGDYISNRAIASWLFARVNSSLENATEEADQVMYTETHYSLRVGLINMTNGITFPPFDQVRRSLTAHSNMAYDANSPSAALSVAEMRDQIIESEVHAVEHHNGDGSLHHVSYTLVDELMANSDPIY